MQDDASTDIVVQEAGTVPESGFQLCTLFLHRSDFEPPDGLLQYSVNGKLQVLHSPLLLLGGLAPPVKFPTGRFNFTHSCCMQSMASWMPTPIISALVWRCQQALPDFVRRFTFRKLRCEENTQFQLFCMLIIFVTYNDSFVLHTISQQQFIYLPDTY